MTFEADGQLHNETGPAGRQIATRASVYGNRLEVTATGSGGNDFSVTFAPLQGGNSLRVTRRVFDESLRAPIVMQSVYRRTSETPDWDLAANDDRYRGGDRSSSSAGSSYNDYSSALVPEGSTLVARLDRPLDLSSARQNDRITLTVDRAPNPELQGATLEGQLLDGPTAANGRTGVSMEFDTIRLRNGRTSEFSGIVEDIRGPSGDPIAYNGEPVGSTDDQRQQAVERGAIGAAVGALIGAVAGGGKGAAIGAVLGGGGAAATVFIDRQGESRLPAGTTFTVRARAPRR